MTSHFKKIKELGKGGMAIVYLAREIATNRLVAVKILKNTTQEDKEYIKRFFREARITAQLDHPNIIKVFESNFAEGLFYIVSEYVDGGDFRKLLEPTYKISLRQKIKILNKVLAALDYAHQKGIVHRDVKPSNILLTRNLEPKLCDFGIATALWGQDSRYTQTNEVIGTMDYIAPEQKESSKTVDFRVDIYSMGVILYQLITGRRPQGAFPPPKQVNAAIPDKLNDIVMKCLQPFPADRYKSTYNLYHEIETTLEKWSQNPDLPGESKNTIAYPQQPSEPKPLTVNGNNETKISHRSAESFDNLVEKLKKGTITEKLNIKPRFIDLVDETHREVLLRLLTNPDTEGFLKETVIQALGKIKSQKACPLLIELLYDPYYNKFAADAIGEIGCTGIEAEEKLFKILLAHTEKSYIALIPLGKLNSVRSIDLIAEYLKDRHSWVREMALAALAMIADDRVRPYVENTANKDPDANTRAKAKKILWRLKK